MSQPIKRNNPAAADPEEVRIKRPALKGVAKVEEVLSPSPPHSPQQDVSHKRKLSPRSSAAVVDNIEQIEQAATESKTQNVVSEMLYPAAAGLSDLPLSAFSTPPSKHQQRVSFSPSPGSEKGSVRSRLKTLSPFAIEIANERVEQYKLERRKKLQAFTNHAELLRKELAEAYAQKAIEWVNEKKITSEIRIDSIVRIFLKKAEEEFERRLHEDFPYPSYEPYINSACFGGMFFFDNFREKMSINRSLALKA